MSGAIDAKHSHQSARATSPPAAQPGLSQGPPQSQGEPTDFEIIGDVYGQLPPMHRTLPPEAHAHLIAAARPVLMAYSAAAADRDAVEADCRISEFLRLPREILVIPRNARGGASAARRRLQRAVARRNSGHSDVAPDAAAQSKPRKAADPTALAIRAATRTIDAGGSRALHRAARALGMREPIAVDQGVVDRLHQLHPRAQGPVPSLPVGLGLPPVRCGQEFEESVQRTLRSMCSGAAPGPSGWTAELLDILTGDVECRKAIAMMASAVAEGDVSGLSAHAMRACVLRALPKPSGGAGAVRPIGMGETIAKLGCRIALEPLVQRSARAKSVLDRVFGDVQFGVAKPGGSETALGLLQLLLLRDQSHVVLSLDFQNAFNARSRQQIATSLYERLELQPLWRVFNLLYGQPSPLLLYGADGKRMATLTSDEGVRQGLSLIHI